MTRTALYHSPLGPIALTTEGEAITKLAFSPIDTLGTIVPIETIPLFQSTRRWLDLYFSGHKPDFTPPLSLHGTAFQQRVWQALLEIPYGHTTTYGALARRIGCRSAQAIGQAVGRNPVAIIVPCHRVVGSNGSLTGYAYGVERKRHLLQIENKTYHR